MSSVASILKSRVVNGNLVASIDGQYIKAATNLPQAIPALANVVSINPTTGELAYQAAGGGGGLFLPLAGGTMDALPAGVISAHTIEDIITLEGTPAGSGLDTTIITNTGNDLNLQTGNTDGLNVDTGQMTINADIRCEINATTIIQPIGGYTYPNAPEVGLTIQNWNNPTANPQFGCEITNIDSANSDAEGLRIQSITATTGTATGETIRGITGDRCAGMNIAIINAATADAIGVNLTSVDATLGNATGYEMTSLNAGQDARAININAITAGANAFGAELNNIVATTGSSYGVVASGVQGDADGFGVSINSITANNGVATGVDVLGITANSGSAFGMNVDGLNAPSVGTEARGANIRNVNADGRAYGFSADNIQANNSFAVGVSATGVESATSTSFGGRFIGIGNVAGNNSAVGVDINGVNQDPANPLTQAFGVECGNIISANSIGSRVRDVIAENRAKGFSAVNIDNNGAGGGFSIGYEATQIVSTAGNATGVRVVGVNGAGQSIGVLVNNAASTNPAVGSYGGLFQRGGKAIGNAGQLLKIFDGNLGLAVQNVADAIGPNNVFGDAGNLVSVDAVVGAGIPITLVVPLGGWEVGHWFLLCKQGLAGPNVVDGGGNLFNGVAGPFAFPGPVGAMCIVFWVGGAVGWAAHAF
jgi:hypothetical protein